MGRHERRKQRTLRSVQLARRGHLASDARAVQTRGATRCGFPLAVHPTASSPSPAGSPAGGNPFIWIQLVDTNGNALTPEYFLGRCVQGQVSAPFVAAASATEVLTVTDCTNNPGPYIYTEGSLSFYPGVKARFIFRNNDNPVGGPHEADAVVDLTLISAGYTLQFPKQPVQGGVGGNPWISVAFVDGNNQQIGSEYLLGRCVQLLPGN